LGKPLESGFRSQQQFENAANGRLGWEAPFAVAILLNPVATPPSADLTMMMNDTA
jgi:hypothetical protein